jgi:FkbM family methyltransferase
MNNDERQKLISTILKHEALRPLSRLGRLVKDPLGAFPYYVVAAISHLKPFKIKFKTLWETKMTCFLPEGNTFYYYGYCEANLTNFFVRYIKENMVVIDVGAHVGIYSMLSAKLVGENGRVFSFEPTPWTFKLLEENTKSLANVAIFNQAISESAKPLTFADYGPGYGAYNSATIGGAPDLKKQPETITVPSISLSQFCQEKSLSPDLIKIDSEGYEYEVLAGSLSILETSGTKRPLVSIEVAGGTAWANNSHQAFTLLQSLKYDPYEIHPNGLISPHTFKDTYTYDNLLFIPQERVIEFTKFLL